MKKSILILLILLTACTLNFPTSVPPPVITAPVTPTTAIISSITPTSTDSFISTPTFTPNPPPAGNLSRAVVYLGGSITVGSGASDIDQTSWRAMVGNWLNSQYPQYAWTHFNAGVKGTPSWYALIRLQTDVIDKRPDLVFVEFSVNDSGMAYGSLIDGFQPASEALIRKLRAELPNAKLVILILGWPDNLLPPDRLASKKNWIALANHYDVQFMRLDLELIKSIGSPDPTAEQVDDYFITPFPNVHPNDKGHNLIAQMIERDMGSLENNQPKPIQEYGYFFNDTILYEAVPVVRFGTDNDGLSGEWIQIDNGIQSSTPGSTVIWSGNISSFGLETNYEKRAGIIEWSVDNQPFKTLDLSKRGAGISEIWNFPKGQHTITIKVVSGKVIIYRFLGI